MALYISHSGRATCNLRNLISTFPNRHNHSLNSATNFRFCLPHIRTAVYPAHETIQSPYRSMLDRSIVPHTQLAKMNFDEIVDLTARCCFSISSIYEAYRRWQGIVRWVEANAHTTAAVEYAPAVLSYHNSAAHRRQTGILSYRHKISPRTKAHILSQVMSQHKDIISLLILCRRRLLLCSFHKDVRFSLWGIEKICSGAATLNPTGID